MSKTSTKSKSRATLVSRRTPHGQHLLTGPQKAANTPVGSNGGETDAVSPNVEQNGTAGVDEAGVPSQKRGEDARRHEGEATASGGNDLLPTTSSLSRDDRGEPSARQNNDAVTHGDRRTVDNSDWDDMYEEPDPEAPLNKIYLPNDDRSDRSSQNDDQEVVRRELHEGDKRLSPIDEVDSEQYVRMSKTVQSSFKSSITTAWQLLKKVDRDLEDLQYARNLQEEHSAGLQGEIAEMRDRLYGVYQDLGGEGEPTDDYVPSDREPSSVPFARSIFQRNRPATPVDGSQEAHHATLDEAIRILGQPRRPNETSEEYHRRRRAHARAQFDKVTARNRASRRGKDEETRLREAGLLPQDAPKSDDRGESPHPPRRSQSPNRGRPSNGRGGHRRGAPGGGTGRGRPPPPPGGGGGGNSDGPSGSDEGSGNESEAPTETSSHRRPRRRSRSRSVQPPPISGVNPRFHRVADQSASRPITSHRPGTRKGDEPVKYRENTMDYIDRVMDEHLLMEPDELPPLSKHTKIPSPPTYEGSEVVKDFDDFAEGYIIHLHLLRLTGADPKIDSERVYMLSTVLKGAAAKWYRSEVTSPYREKTFWTFAEVLHALHKRFVYQSSAAVAASNWDNTKYDPKDGVAGLYTELCSHARDMSYRPDAYTTKRKLMNELPLSIVEPMMKNRSITAEHSTIEEIILAAKDMENANKALRGYRKAKGDAEASRPIASRREEHTASSTTNGHRNGNSSSRAHRRSSSHGRRTDTGSHRANRVRFQPSRPSPPTRPSGREPQVASSASRARPASRPADRRPSSSGKAVDKRNITCFACGGQGHYSTDAECPKFRGPSMRRMEEEADELEPSGSARIEELPDDEQATEPVEEDPVGPQYESQDEYELDQYEEFEYQSSYYDASSSDSDERFAGMRIPRTGSEPVILTADNAPIWSFSMDSDRFLRSVVHTLALSSQRMAELTHELENLRTGVDSLVDIAVRNRIADAITQNPTRVEPGRLFQTEPSTTAEYGRGSDELRIDLLSETLSRFAYESADMRTELFTLWSMIDHESTHSLLPQLAFSGRHRETVRSLLWEQRDPNEWLSQPGPSTRPATTNRAVEWLRQFPDEANIPTVNSDYRAAQEILRDRLDPHPEDTESYDIDSDEENLPPLITYPWGEDGPAVLEHDVPTLEDTTIYVPDDEDNEGDVTIRPSPRSASPDSWESDDAAMVDYLSQLHLRLMQVERLGAMSEPIRQRSSMRVTSQTKPRPELPSACLIVQGSINGLAGTILLDSGSSVNAISPAFGGVAGITAYTLEKPIGLQLGCVGSRSKINFGAQLDLTIGERKFPTYFDVVNLDHYDMVLGIPFMRQHEVILDFSTSTVRFGRTPVPTLQGGGKSVVRHKSSTKVARAIKPAKE